MAQVIEGLYQDYLKKVKLTEKEMNPVQKVETRRAFFGAAGLILSYFKDTIADMDEEVGAEAIEELWRETMEFWLYETSKKS